MTERENVVEDQYEFIPGNVPVAIASKVYGKDPTWIRAGIVAGWLPIGVATRNGVKVTNVDEIDSKLGKISFYISPKLLYEHTGFMWKGEKKWGQY